VQLALGMFFVLELLVTLDSAVRHGPRPEAYTFLIAPDELWGFPGVRWCSEAVPAILSLIPLATRLIY
jgi:hypothetical protein